MSYGLHPDLLAAAGWSFAACFLLLARPYRAALAFLLALVKIGIPLLHFSLGLLDTGAWRLIDDVKYVEEAASLRGTLLAGGAGLGEQLFATAEGHHVGYYVWNILAQQAFGEHYFSAVFLNVVLTCVAVRGLLRLLRLVGAGRGYALALGAFFLLHWDVIAWSSFFNMKDPMVMTLTVWLFVFAMELALRARTSALFGFALVCATLYFFRWYVPILVGPALGAWGIFHLRGWRRGVLVVAAAAVLVIVPLRGQVPTELLQPAGLLDGAFRFAMTPRPWGMSEGYRFLLFPSALHWLLTPIAVFGAVHLWRRHPLARPLLLYVVVLFCFYAIVPRLYGPRHRFQCVFVLAWLQFHGLYAGLAQAFARPRGRLRPRRPVGAHA